MLGRLSENIPKEFLLGGHKIVVHIHSETENEKSGVWLPEESVIRLWPKGRSYDFMLQTFFHELTHAIKDIWCRPDESTDEDKIDVMGQGLMQFAKTAKYPKT
ncbi:MAG: hypothetical protein QQN63_09275 [Nitrosopumilus sp.]